MASLSAQTNETQHQHPGSNEPVAQAAITEAHGGDDMPAQGAMEFEDVPLPAPGDAEYLPYEPMSLDPGPFGLLLFDQLEYRYLDGDDLFRWDVEGWYGGDVSRFWFSTEGEQNLQGPDAGEFEVHGYYGRLIAPFWDAQAGLRFDESWEPGDRDSRAFAAFGVQGFAPYRFEVSPTVFVSEDGDASFRFTASKDYRISQRLVAQPRFETEYAFSSAPEFGVGTGFNYLELGLRLRYEFTREFAPYIGIEWEKELGDTADLSRADGEDTDVLSLVAGVRLWF